MRVSDVDSASLTARRVARLLQGVLAAVLAVGLVVGNVSIVVNAALGLAVTELPALLRRDFGIYLAPILTLWIAVAVTIHALGMLLLYERVVWWDHLTHVVSASLVASVGYAAARSFDIHSDAVHFPQPFLAVYVVLFTLAAGVVWELAEMLGRDLARAAGMEPILIVYGLEDTMMDLVFDAVGAVLAAVVAVGRPVERTVRWREPEERES